MQQQQRTGSTTVDVAGLAPEHQLRLVRLARELRLVDQILSTDVDRVAVVTMLNKNTPAWTSGSGEAISFNAARMPDPKDRESLAVWLGTNAHELGHVIFSPRSSSPLMRQVRSGEATFLRGLFKLWNIVEDQRQERLLLARYSPWRGYLIAALGHHLKADNNSAWLLMAGRTWLPASVRAEARRLFVAHRGEALAQRTAELIGAYQRLTDPGDTQRAEAWEVLEELHRLFEGEIPVSGGCGGEAIGDGEPVTDAEPVGDPFPAADDVDDDDESDDESDDGDEPCDDGEPGESTSTGKSRDRKPDDSRDDESDDAERGRSVGDSTDATDDDAPEAEGAGNESAPPTEQDEQSKWREQLSDAAADQIHDDASASDELDGILDAVENGRGVDDADGPDAPGSFKPASDAARRLHREVAEALVDFKDASEPGWVKRTDSGRLNVRRLTDPYVDADELFDRYEPGALDASQLEAVLLLDVSGSMSGQTQKLGEAAWAIRMAVDDLEGRITVLTYDETHYVLARPGERPDDRMVTPDSLGGTNPESALSEAWLIIGNSEARNRLVVVMTDGDWSGNERNEQLIAAMRNAGVATVMAYLPQKYAVERAVPMHGCELGGRIESLDDLPRLFQHVALAQMHAQFR